MKVWYYLSETGSHFFSSHAEATEHRRGKPAITQVRCLMFKRKAALVAFLNESASI